MGPINYELTAFLTRLFKPDELLRFVRYEFGERSNLPSLLRSSQAAYEIVQWLSYEGKIEEFFGALHRAFPDRQREIERAMDAYHRASGAPKWQEPPSDDTTDIEPSDEKDRSEWRSRMVALLDADPEPETSPGLAWLEAAAVQPTFDPYRLKPVPGKGDPEKDALIRLAPVCDVLPDGRWSLQLEQRQETIARLWKEDRLGEALEANPYEPSSPSAEVSWHRELLEQIAKFGYTYPERYEDDNWLAAARDLLSWFKTSGHSPFDPDRISAGLERRVQIAPLRLLTGTHFRGRKAEYADLIDHQQGSSTSPILVLSGKGGVGKSALLGKFLLDLERMGRSSPPWVYLDFDHPDIDVTQPRKMIEVAARQLSLLSLDRSFIALESAAANDRPLGFNAQESAGKSESELLAELDPLIRSLSLPKPLLLVVFDTFEQVQARGEPAVKRARHFIDELVRAVPYVRVIVSGRAPVMQWPDATELTLGDLDPESADAVLEALKIPDKRLREIIIQQVGTTPLSLRLAAQVIESSDFDATDLEAMMKCVKEADRIGYLYTRILGHIPDEEVRRLAHPGLIVRRLTSEVIAKVLSSICEIDPRHADDLFKRLPNFVSLFERDTPGPNGEAALKHRQDVREMMLVRMAEDPALAGTLESVHQAAAAYYDGFPSPVHRAEGIYHRMKLDADLEELDALWPAGLDDASDAILVASLGRCWEEVLSEQARQWLGLRIGRTSPSESTMRDADQEFSVYQKAKLDLQRGQAQEALDSISNRTTVKPGSPLALLQLRSLISTGSHAEAGDLLKESLTALAGSDQTEILLQLHLLGCELSLKNPRAQEDFRRHSKAAQALAKQLGDEISILKISEANFKHALQQGDAEDIEKRGKALASSYAKISWEYLLGDEELSKRIVDLVGAKSKGVLIKAALTFGNRQVQGVMKPDAIALEALLTQAPLRRKQLTKFAVTVGLPSDRYGMIDLAGAAIRFARMGDLVADVLKSSGDIPQVRELAKAMFHPPTSPT